MYLYNKSRAYLRSASPASRLNVFNLFVGRLVSPKNTDEENQRTAARFNRLISDAGYVPLEIG